MWNKKAYAFRNFQGTISLKFVVVLRCFPKPAGFVIPLQVDDFKKILRKFGELLLILRFKNFNDSAISSHRGARRHFPLSPIRVQSAEGSMPWRGDLRAETGIFYSLKQINFYRLPIVCFNYFIYLCSVVEKYNTTTMIIINYY